MKKITKSFKAFTLVELVVTITLIVVLSSISVPIYKDYIYKAKTAEAYTLFATIKSAQMQYYNEYGVFLSGYTSCSGGYTDYDPVLDVNARTNKYYTWFSVNSIYFTNNAIYYSFTPVIKTAQWSTAIMTYNLTKQIEYSGLQ